MNCLNLIKDLKNIPLYYRSMDLKSLFLFFKAPFLVRRCILYLNADFKTIGNKIIVNLRKYNGLYLYVDNISNLLVILDVFFLTSYKIISNSKAIVIDIGLNIGASALFFSQYENIEHIYAFEPFKETYEQAVDNLKLNKNLQNKITAYNYGLSDKEEIKNVLYSKKRSGSMSVMSDFYHSELKVKDMHLSKVTLKAADKEISNIISKTTNQIILKIDCEGSEYAIIDSLKKRSFKRYRLYFT
jgi:FkbM family methyltransferase